MKKVLIIVLTIAMMAALAACGNGSKDSGNGGVIPGSGGAPAAAENTLTGTYTAQLDMSEVMAESDYTFSNPLIVSMQMTLKEDETFDIGMDVNQFLADVESFYNEEMPSLVDQMFKEQNITDDVVSQQLKDMGYDSLDVFIDEQIQQAMSALQEQYQEESGYHSYVEGVYKVDGDKISFSASADQEGELKDNCKINEDGSITLTINLDEQDYDLVFKK